MTLSQLHVLRNWYELENSILWLSRLTTCEAARISDTTAFFLLGDLVEYDSTPKMFTSPEDKRDSDYITGRFGWRQRGAKVT